MNRNGQSSPLVGFDTKNVKSKTPLGTKYPTAPSQENVKYVRVSYFSFGIELKLQLQVYHRASFITNDVYTFFHLFFNRFVEIKFNHVYNHVLDRGLGVCSGMCFGNTIQLQLKTKN